MTPTLLNPSVHAAPRVSFVALIPPFYPPIFQPVYRKLSLTISLGASLLASHAHAGALDKTAEAAITRTLNEYYLAAKIDGAEKRFLAIIADCGSECSASVVAKAWMYTGIARGSGRGDLLGAREAFVNALAVDPRVQLDQPFSTPEVIAAFQEAKGAANPAARNRNPAPSDGMECSPSVTEVQLNSPVPISCVTGESPATVELRYRAEESGPWETIAMDSVGGSWQGRVPCGATVSEGVLYWLVRALDEDGEPLDKFGSKREPISIFTVEKTEQEPPHFPGEAAPELCDGSEAGTACEVDADCDAGVCVSGTCEFLEDAGTGTSRPWVALTYAFDIALGLGEKGVCSLDSTTGYDCFIQAARRDPFISEVPYGGDPHPDFAGNVEAGIKLATQRLLATYDHPLTDKVSVGGRVGLAFLGGPTGGQGGSPFMPLHLDARAKYWLKSAGGNGRGFYPYVVGSLGLAQVDMAVELEVIECDYVSEGIPRHANDDFGDLVQKCKTSPASGRFVGDDFGTQNGDDPRDNPTALYTFDAYKRMGRGFLSGGAGGIYLFSDSMGVVFNLDLMIMLPSTGIVIQPSLGLTMGL